MLTYSKASRKSFKAAAIVVATCMMATLLFVLAVWIGEQLPTPLFDGLQQWVPRGWKYAEILEGPSKKIIFESDWQLGMPLPQSYGGSPKVVTEIISTTETFELLPWSSNSIAALFIAVIFTGVILFIAHGLSLFCSDWWVRWIAGPEYWRDSGFPSRRDVVARAWRRSALFLIVSLPIVELIWMVCYRTWEAGNQGPARALPTLAMDVGFSTALLGWLAVPVIDFLVITHLLAPKILIRNDGSSAAEGNRRCLGCGYPLMTPGTEACSECGFVEAQPFAGRLAWLRNCTSRCWNKWGLLLWIVPLLLLIAPIVSPQLRVLFKWLGSS